MRTDQQGGALSQLREVDRIAPMQSVPALQRRAPRAGEDAVAVGPRRAVVTRVEAVGHALRGKDRDIRREQGIEAAQRGSLTFM